MCLIVFAYKTHPRFDLILAANRDEAYKRPTRAAQFWKEHPDILAGKDLRAGGTWMGVNRRGQFAALTNYRNPSIIHENPPSRGGIVLRYLAQNKSPETFLKTLHPRTGQFMGFNLLAGTPEELFHYSNQEQKMNRVAPGIHGLSNYLLDTPWPKVERAKAGLRSWIDSTNPTQEKLFNLLKNDQPAPDNELPDTGIPHEIEKKVSPIFISSEAYGTRCSTVLLIDKQGKASFEERRFKKGTREVKETNRFEFEIEP